MFFQYLQRNYIQHLGFASKSSIGARVDGRKLDELIIFEAVHWDMGEHYTALSPCEYVWKFS